MVMNVNVSGFKNICRNRIRTLRMMSGKSISNGALDRGFYIQSPLIKHNDRVSYKMDYLQPSGSFKDRGIGYMVETLNSGDKGPVEKLICSR